MPLVEVKLYDARVTEESVPRIIEAMTDALAESSGASRDHIWVILEGVSPKNWGVAGQGGAYPRRCGQSGSPVPGSPAGGGGASATGRPAAFQARNPPAR